MNINLTKSSLLAAQEIIRDKTIKQHKDLNYLESHKTTLDISNGKKIIDTLGSDIISEFNQAPKDSNRQLILRKILMSFIKKAKPGFMFRITGGRTYFLDYVSENFEQLFNLEI